MDAQMEKSAMLLNVAVEDFLRYCAIERQLSQHTVEAYANDLSDFCRFLPTGASIGTISEVELTKYLADLLDRRKLAVATVRRRFACLRAFNRRLVTLGKATDLFSKWRLQLPRRKRLPRALSKPQVMSLLTGFASQQENSWPPRAPRFSTAVRLMVATGIRVGELCKVRVEDVSPDGRSLRIHGKGARDRVAYISDVDLRSDLEKLVDWHRRTGGVAGNLFLNRRALPLKPQSIRSELRRYSARIGAARRITPHMLRHTAATLLIQRGVDIRMASSNLPRSASKSLILQR
jgi:site-specific recombinase XerD